MVISPIEVQRQVTLAMVLEPLAEKEGCTTRMVDLSKETSLYNFQTTAVNAGRYFYRLAERIKKAHGQPEVFEDLFYKALFNSLQNISTNKFITYGLLELFFPFVIARLTTEDDGIAVCKQVPTVLKKSSERDVLYLDKTRSLAWSTSKKDYKKNFVKEIGGKDLYEHYSKNHVIAQDVNFQTGVLWTEQLLKGMPLVQAMYEEAKIGLEKKEESLHYISRIYNIAEKDFPSQGARADYTGIVLYLLIAENPKSTLFY